WARQRKRYQSQGIGGADKKTQGTTAGPEDRNRGQDRQEDPDPGRSAHLHRQGKVPSTAERFPDQGLSRQRFPRASAGDGIQLRAVTAGAQVPLADALSHGLRATPAAPSRSSSEERVAAPSKNGKTKTPLGVLGARLIHFQSDLN